MKSPDAFRTISEVADELDLPQHVLRFWETKFAAVRPMKRGGGRRYYRPADVSLLKGIRHLLYSEGYTIKGVQKILKDQGNRFVIELVEGLGRGAALSLAPVAADDDPDDADGQDDEVVLAPVLRGGAARDGRREPRFAGDGGANPGRAGAVGTLKRVLHDLKSARETLHRARQAD